jgi:RNA polymerase sigma-70 factor, ECF subfamily
MEEACFADDGGLFEQYHDRIYRYVLRLMRNPGEAEDLTQDIFLRAYCRRDSLRDQQALVAWLYRIATRVCLDRLRQHTPELSLDGKTRGNVTAAAASPHPSALEIAERTETSECVQRCLQFLPDSYRAVIILYEINSLTAAQMATVLGENLTTVKMRLHRARRLLRHVMECGCAVSNDCHGMPVCQPKSQK